MNAYSNEIPIKTVTAGTASGTPSDSPTARVDSLGASSPFNFVGSLHITNGVQTYTGSASALSPNWVLTAAHNIDFNDDGNIDSNLSVQFHLPGIGSYTASGIYINPDFGGFNNPNVHDDLALLYFEAPISAAVSFPGFASLNVGDVGTIVGFGRSGYGNLGYSTAASTTIRRVGQNVIDTFWLDDEGSGLNEVFVYDFDDPLSAGFPGGSLGNHLESMIGPGDSGGPLLLWQDGSYSIAGVNTFILGSSGIFGDRAGGIVIDPYLDWISATTGLAIIPETSTTAAILGLAALFSVICSRRRLRCR